jgi:hypothetical protein
MHLTVDFGSLLAPFANLFPVVFGVIMAWMLAMTATMLVLSKE